MNKQILNSLGIGAALMLSSCNMNKQKKLNVLFLFTDDQRYNTIAALGNQDIQTPNIDRIVKSGLSFTHAHIMGGTSGAVSMPSRAMLLTGKSIFHLKSKGASIPEDHIMMPEYFRNNAYQTFGTGKWHNGKQSYYRCFDTGGKIMFRGMSDHLKVPVFDFDSTGKYPKENEYIADKFSSEIFADEAVNFIETRSGTSPFFAYVSFSAPHDPRMAPEEYNKMYPQENIPVPENFLPEHPFNNGELKVRDEKLAPWPRTHEIVKDHLGKYYAMITHTDYHIGRILDALENSGQADNTIIVFASDNGLAVGSHGLMGKQNVYEHGVRVPLIISGPGIPRNKQTSALVYLNDIFPGLCELNDLEIPESVESISILPIIKNKNATIRNEVFYVYRNFQRGLRTREGQKIILYNVNNENTNQRFDLNTDPLEKMNLFNTGHQDDLFYQLETRLENYMNSVDDPMDLNSENWGKEIIVIPDTKVDHKAVGKEVILGTLYSTKYDGGGAPGLVDGKRALPDFNDENWQGYHQNDLSVIVDMGAMTKINLIAGSFLENTSSWIFIPKYIEYAISGDGEKFELVYINVTDEPKDKEGAEIREFKTNLNNKSARYIRIIARNVGLCPEWHVGAGEKAWIFTDEIIIN